MSTVNTIEAEYDAIEAFLSADDSDKLRMILDMVRIKDRFVDIMVEVYFAYLEQRRTESAEEVV